jgi:hypothetical protein
MPLGFFARVWIGIAGVLHQPDIEAFQPFVRRAFGFEEGDGRLRITNGTSTLSRFFRQTGASSIRRTPSCVASAATSGCRLGGRCRRWNRQRGIRCVSPFPSPFPHSF